MSDILLRELSNADIDWMVTTGKRQVLGNSAVLITPDDSLDALYLVLEGAMTMSAPCSGREFAQLGRGELFGASWLFNAAPVCVIAAKGSAKILAIPKTNLLEKLRTDASFATHFYRAIALMMSERIRTQFEAAQSSQPADLLRYQSGQMVKEALFVFGELHDSDIDWMMSTGKIRRVESGEVVLNMGRPVDALYTVLDGQLAIATTDTPYDPFSGCSDTLAKQPQAFTTLAYIYRGGLPGIISFLDLKPLPVRIQATQESVLLTIDRQQTIIKLQEDLSFAARFYHVIAAQTAHLLNSVTAVECAAVGDNSSNMKDKQDEDELDIEQLQKASQGGKKFDWMLKQLKVEA